MKILNASNHAAYGADVTKDGTRYQFANMRGKGTLYYATLDEDGVWHHVLTVDSPERFGMTRPPRNYEEFKRVVEAFLNA